MAIALLALLGGHADPAVPPGFCDLHPGHIICEGGGSDPGDPGDEDGAGTFAWGPVEPLATVCTDTPPRPRYLQRLVWASGPDAGEFVDHADFPSNPGPGDPVPGGPPGAVFAADGFVYRWICSSLDIAADVWAEARRRMDSASVDKSPAVSGLTGLDTWVWYGRDPTVPPFQLSWTDPGTGFVWTLEAWAWVAEFTWDLGDGTVHRVSASDLVAARAAAGSEHEPAVEHPYRTTSVAAGHAAGYPVTFHATWIGEYRWSDDGGSTWSIPVLMPGSFTDTAAIAYEVLQVRSALVVEP